MSIEFQEEGNVLIIALDNNTNIDLDNLAILAAMQNVTIVQLENISDISENNYFTIFLKLSYLFSLAQQPLCLEINSHLPILACQAFTQALIPHRIRFAELGLVIAPPYGQYLTSIISFMPYCQQLILDAHGLQDIDITSHPNFFDCFRINFLLSEVIFIHSDLSQVLKERFRR